MCLVGTKTRFISNDATDTHAQVNVSEEKMLVVAFRGTGSLANIGTDCHIKRTAVTYRENLSRGSAGGAVDHSECRDGLHFESEEKSWVSFPWL